jgi:hypothetical protein
LKASCRINDCHRIGLSKSQKAIRRLTQRRERLEALTNDPIIGEKAMEISGTVQNGVVVLDGSVSLPEGANVVVIYRATPVIRVAKNRKRVELPLFPSSEPGSLDLTNERIAEILDEEEIEAMKRTWNEPS